MDFSPQAIWLVSSQITLIYVKLAILGPEVPICISSGIPLKLMLIDQKWHQMIGNHEGHNFSIENVFLKSIFIPILMNFWKNWLKNHHFYEKIDDWVVRPRVAMATKMKKLTRMFKS